MIAVVHWDTVVAVAALVLTEVSVLVAAVWKVATHFAGNLRGQITELTGVMRSIDGRVDNLEEREAYRKGVEDARTGRIR